MIDLISTTAQINVKRPCVLGIAKLPEEVGATRTVTEAVTWLSVFDPSM